MSDENDQVVETDEIEQEARSMGWLPEEEFKGDKAKWVDAGAYVDRGRHLIPIITENNKRLKNELLTMTRKFDKVTQDHEKSLKILEGHFAKISKQAVEDAKKSLKEQLRQAREDGDLELEVDTLEKLQDLKNDTGATPDQERSTQTQADTGLSPDFLRWQSDNPWFGQDKKKTKAILRIAEDLRDDGDTTEGYDFFEKCLSMLEPADGKPAVSRVEAGSRGSGRSTSGKSFNDLPQEAKMACWADVDDLVGPNKSYKTKADWEKAYASIYFGSAE